MSYLKVELLNYYFNFVKKIELGLDKDMPFYIDTKRKNNQGNYLIKSLNRTKNLINENPILLDSHKNSFINVYIIIHISSYLDLNDIISLAHSQKAYLYSLYGICIKKIIYKTLRINKFIRDMIYLKDYFSQEMESLTFETSFPENEKCKTCKKYIYARFFEYVIQKANHRILYIWVETYCKKCIQERKYRYIKSLDETCILNNEEKDIAYKMSIIKINNWRYEL